MRCLPNKVTFGRKERYIWDVELIAPSDHLNNSSTVECLFVDANGDMCRHFGQTFDEVIDVFGALLKPLGSKRFVNFDIISVDKQCQ